MVKGYLKSTEIAQVSEEEKLIILVPSTGMIHELDEVSNFIWEQIPSEGNGITANCIAEKIVEIYDVDYDTALIDVEAILDILQKESIVYSCT